MNDKIKNAIVNAIESAVNDSGDISISAVDKTSYSNYIYALFLDGINTSYKANKRNKYDYQLMETLLKNACKKEATKW